MAQVLCCKENTLKIFIAGDSTAAPKFANKRPETGWGERLGCFLIQEIPVSNHAHNGESTKSFFATGRAGVLFEQVSQGDVVLIQFGHNDEHDKPHQHTDANGDFKDNLSKMIETTRSLGAVPVLMTPIARRSFNSDGSVVDTHGLYAQAIRELANKLDVFFVDMAHKTERLIESLGETRSVALFNHAEKGVVPNYPDGVDDHTHLCPHGAYAVAALAAHALDELGIPELHGAFLFENEGQEPNPETGDGDFPVDQARFQ